jgi:hypothetical protein
MTMLDIHHLVKGTISRHIIALYLKELTESNVFSHMRHAGVLAELLDDGVCNLCFEASLEVGGIVKRGLG